MIGLDTQFSQVYANRGLVYYDLKKYNKAINDYSKVIELNPQIADVYYKGKIMNK